MVLSCIISWKRSRLLVPMACSSSSLHRATSWGRSRCSRVSSSSNSFENWTMSFVVGCSPVPRTWRRHMESLMWSTETSKCHVAVLTAAIMAGLTSQGPFSHVPIKPNYTCELHYFLRHPKTNLPKAELITWLINYMIDRKLIVNNSHN